MVSEKKQPVEFFKHLDGLKAQLIQKDVFVFLDYDGTLTPIVSSPDLAVLSEDMRTVVRRLAGHYKISIVSGRATDDVRKKVQIDGIFYAGSHGFEIVDPQGNVKINEEAQKIRPIIDKVHAQLGEQLKGIKGALVEHVKYTISVHYRLVSDEDCPRVEQAVDAILKEYNQLRKTSGKKVFEIRPKIDWHKGKAVEWILGVLGYKKDKTIVIYVGDDVTDEDAFGVLANKGFGILVAAQPRESKAQYMIKDTAQVKQVLKYLIQIKNQ